MQFSPMAGFTPGAGLKYDNRPRHHYVTGIVAVQSTNPTKIVDSLNGRKHLPDFVVCLSEGWLATKKVEGDEKQVTIGHAQWGYEKFIWARTGKRTITIMNMLLQTELLGVRLPMSQAKEVLGAALEGVLVE